MAGKNANLVDLVMQVGPAPEGVDQIDFVIASLPGGELMHAAKNSTFTYEGLAEIVRKDPAFLERFDSLPHPEKSLADDILERQHILSGPRRRLATFASILALGGGGFAFGYTTDMQVQHEVFGQHPHAVEGVKPGGDTEALQDGAILGGASGVLAGFVVYMTGLVQSGRLARRPAQKRVDRARIS